MRRLVWLVSLTGCFAPAAPSGAPCAAGRTCPDGLACTATPDGDRCLAEGVGGGNPDGGNVTGDGPATCTPKVLLAGGTDIAAQGWQVVGSGGTITYGNGVTELRTTNSAAATPQQMIALANAVPLDRFDVEFTVDVVASGGHAMGDASLAIMASFHAPTGSDIERKQLVFLDTDKIGLGGGTSVGVTTAGMHTYVVGRTATGNIHLEFSGGQINTGPFTSNGTIAIGDQSATPGFDSTIRIAQIRLMCP